MLNREFLAFAIAHHSKPTVSKNVIVKATKNTELPNQSTLDPLPITRSPSLGQGIAIGQSNPAERASRHFSQRDAPSCGL
jgi:hypothetical protein